MAGEKSRLQGIKAEQLALVYLLEQEPFQVLAQNFRCRFGELDLILGGTEPPEQPSLIFVEMRYRENDRFGGALQSVTYAKRQKISRTARFFLAKYTPRYDNHLCRFDVLAMSGHLSRPKYEWLKNAFNLC